MSQENVEIVRRAYAAFNPGDPVGLDEVISADPIMDWSLRRGRRTASTTVSMGRRGGCRCPGGLRGVRAGPARVLRLGGAGSSSPLGSRAGPR